MSFTFNSFLPSPTNNAQKVLWENVQHFPTFIFQTHILLCSSQPCPFYIPFPHLFTVQLTIIFKGLICLFQYITFQTMPNSCRWRQECLRDAVWRKRRDKWQGEWCLYHDNEPSHILLVVQQFLAEKIIPVVTQPPYSLDLAPSDFWLFPTLKMGLKGMRFTTMEDVKLNVTAELWKIPKEAFRRCFQQW